eukprot:jgi/Botrbrau1/9815/Bobra.0322s0019.1
MNEGRGIKRKSEGGDDSFVEESPLKRQISGSTGPFAAGAFAGPSRTASFAGEDLGDGSRRDACTHLEFMDRRIQDLQQLCSTYQEAFYFAAEEYRAALAELAGDGENGEAKGPASTSTDAAPFVPVRDLVLGKPAAAPASEQVPQREANAASPASITPTGTLRDPGGGSGAEQATPSTDAVLAAIHRELQEGRHCVCPASTRDMWRKQLVYQLPKIAPLEQAACSELSRLLERVGAVAALCLSAHRFLIYRTCFTFGRSEAGAEKLDVDWRLVTESKVPSEMGGVIQLRTDGNWIISVDPQGRPIHVNNHVVPPGKAIALKQASLVDVGQLPFIFFSNHRAVKTLIYRTENI